MTYVPPLYDPPSMTRRRHQTRNDAVAAIVTIFAAGVLIGVLACRCAS